MLHLVLLFELEELVYGHSQLAGDPERQQRRRYVLAFLYRQNRLPTHASPSGELFLSEIEARPVLLEVVSESDF